MTRLIIIIAALAMISGCRPTLIRTSSDDVIMPLRVGNWWKARVTTAGGGHGEDGRPTVESEETRIVADTVINGRRWFVINDSSRLAYAPDGVQGSFDSPYWQHEYRLRMPERAGDTVRIDVYTHNAYGRTGRDSIYGVVRKLDTIISVPAGSFRCWMVSGGGSRGSGGQQWAATFYTKGIGKVKEEGGSSSLIHRIDFTWELTEYELH